VVLIGLAAGCLNTGGVDPLVNFRVPVGGRCQPDPDQAYPACAVLGGGSVGPTRSFGGSCYKGICHRNCSQVALPPEPVCPMGEPAIEIDEPPDLLCICAGAAVVEAESDAEALP